MSFLEQEKVYLKPHQKNGVQQALLGRLNLKEFAYQHGEEAAKRLEELIRSIKTNPQLPIIFNFDRSDICHPDCEQILNCDPNLIRPLDRGVLQGIIIGKPRPAVTFFHLPTGKNG
ncbi:MAG: hypothetical protein V1858_03230 [Candidatus Gottesmanbacteria bacterium]